MLPNKTPFSRLLCANRGEIAVRVFRAATELGLSTVAIYSHEDRLSIHRYKAEESYLIGVGKAPVAAYLDMDDIIALAKREKIDAIHPGYGFLSENAVFAQKCIENGIVWVGPDPTSMDLLGSKTNARALAIKVGVSVVSGSDGPLKTPEEGQKFVESIGFPIIIKAAMGGGGRGMRVVRTDADFAESFSRCQSEALNFFGDATVFIERYIEKPRHIEVQILADKFGNVVHLFERDCSVQRRHQKVIEIAPALHLSQATKDRIFADALKLMKAASYKNAGTVEFLVDEKENHYFIEVNPRIQVEHTITEQLTGVDLVQSQIMVAAGSSLSDLGLTQDKITARGYAIQCRVTTEDPKKNFQPSTGKIIAYRSPLGNGIRLDVSAAFTGAVITPHFDSLLVKIVGYSLTFDDVLRKLQRALIEMRIKGVKTNMKFLLKILTHPQFQSGLIFTNFIDSTPELFNYEKGRYMIYKLTKYLAHVAVNGCIVPGTTFSDLPLPLEDPVVPNLSGTHSRPTHSWRQIFLDHGPEALAKAVRQHRGALITDTTWRDAHQSLLATRMRTIDLTAIAEDTSIVLGNAFSLEMWGGATFDVALRFLNECPWERLRKLREKVPNVLFQMLLRGANAVGYTAYPDNVVYQFVKLAKDNGVDVFRIFDSLNYVENLKLGIDAVRKAGGIVEASISYTGDVSDPNRTKYSLQYYVDLARELVACGTHILGIKDMAGLLKPRAATLLIGALRKEFPDLPIHVHTHDTAGTGVASMLAALEAGADIVDTAVDAMSGLTSQPSMGAVVSCLEGTPMSTGISAPLLYKLNDYWDQVRQLYGRFESTLRSGCSDVYLHEMPGGQYTNLQFQAHSLGLTTRWAEIKRAYSEANQLLGDIVKVTPSSKVVGDLAQFMVQNNLDAQKLKAQASTLSLPNSVVEYFQGMLGQPAGGFPEPLRSDVLRGKPTVDGRPGASLPPLDWDQHREKLQKKFPGVRIRDVDLVSSALYPKVFEEYLQNQAEYGDVSLLPTRYFLVGLPVGQECTIDTSKGRSLLVKLLAVGYLNPDGKREVFFEVNGATRTLKVEDKKAASEVITRERARPDVAGEIGAPMSGAVAEIRVKVGTDVRAGDPVCVLSAMKMETTVTSPVAGKVVRIAVSIGDSLAAGDLIVLIEK